MAVDEKNDRRLREAPIGNSPAADLAAQEMYEGDPQQEFFPDPLPDDVPTQDEPPEPAVEQEESLDHFLDETTALRVAAEEVLEDLAQWEQPERIESNPQPPVSLLQESLEQLSYSLGTKFDLVNSFVRDSTDVLDGRLALTTRLLSERADESSVALAQLSNELVEASETLKDIRGKIAQLAERPSPEPQAPSLEPVTDQIEALREELSRMINAGTLTLSRQQHDFEKRVAKLEAAFSRSARRPSKKTENAYFGLAIFLLFVNALMILWLRFGH